MGFMELTILELNNSSLDLLELLVEEIFHFCEYWCLKSFQPSVKEVALLL